MNRATFAILLCLSFFGSFAIAKEGEVNYEIKKFYITKGLFLTLGTKYDINKGLKVKRNYIGFNVRGFETTILLTWEF